MVDEQTSLCFTSNGDEIIENEEGVTTVRPFPEFASFSMISSPFEVKQSEVCSSTIVTSIPMPSRYICRVFQLLVFVRLPAVCFYFDDLVTIGGETKRSLFVNHRYFYFNA